MNRHLAFHCVPLLLLASSAFGQVTPGNLVVVRVGDGVSPLGSNATPAVIEEYDRVTPDQLAPLLSIPLPTTAAGANRPLTMSGSAVAEGFLTQSVDGRFFLVAGYAASPGLAGPGATTSATVNRVIGRIDLTGAVDTTTALTDAHNAGSIRGAVSVDGSSFWTTGSGNTTPGTNRGITHVSALGATTSTSITTTITNARVASIHDGQLYVSTASTGFVGVNAIGTGLPTTSGQSAALLPGFSFVTGTGTISQYDFWFADAQTCYVADDRSAANGGGIQKWVDVAGSWTFQYTLSPGTGCRGLSGIRDQNGTQLFATTTTTFANALVTVMDTGPTAPFLTLATAPPLTVFRGVRFVRTPSSTMLAGIGCPTTVGIPTIAPVGAPVSGNGAFALAVGNAPASTLWLTIVSIGLPLGSGLPLSLTIDTPACVTVYPQTFDIALSGLTDTAGNGILPLGLPVPDSSLWGLLLGSQHLVFDAAISPSFTFPLGSSQGLQITIGN